MTKSLIICWIMHCDYPIFRKWLGEYYNLFDEIIIYWSDHFRHMYYDKFIEESLKHLPNIKFLPFQPYEYGVADWRNVATNRMLNIAKGDWIISIEQDYFVRDWKTMLDKIWNTMNENKADLVGHWQEADSTEKYPGYIHPAFWFIKRSTLEKTSKDFAVHSGEGKCDHFGIITRDVIDLGGKIVRLEDFGYSHEDWHDFFHLGGVNQNYLEGLKDSHVFHRADIFSVYNHWSQLIDVKQSPEFMELMRKIEAKLPPTMEDLEKWSIFFK